MGKYILKALTGPVKGQVFLVKEGLKIGRTLGDIVLKDSLVSSLHAEIKIYSSGKIMIIDKDSKNKILINDQKMVKSVLQKGSRFKIGQTLFEMDFIKNPEEILSDFIQDNTKKLKDQPLALKPFVQAIELIFTSGLQQGQRYYLTYGPRIFGSESLDFPLFEPSAPSKAFAFIPEMTKTLFITKHPEIVKLNGKKIKKAEIHQGDHISIGNSFLKLNLK